ncbi:hypothetical protein VNO78_16076 [Psophocarpus tetragonolobus]|uniref:Uncharacterized protein n=1 Tax=Psophocarpus tetragonolobus TaxID=3891 RepID=A0AAN9XJR7_PSOTE
MEEINIMKTLNTFLLKKTLHFHRIKEIMKNRTTLLALFLLCAFSSTARSYVYDTDGDRLTDGSRYYVLPVEEGSFGGIEATATGKDTCPLTVVQSSDKNSKGIPISIILPYSRTGLVRDDFPLIIRFVPSAVTTSCVGISTAWSLVNEAVRLDVDPNDAVHGYLEIDIVSSANHHYKFKFCGRDSCRSVGAFDDAKGKRRLVLSNNPLLVKFEKVQHSVAHDTHLLGQDSYIGQDSYFGNSVALDTHVGQDRYPGNSVAQDSYFENSAGQDTRIGQDRHRGNSVSQDSNIGQDSHFENLVGQDNHIGQDSHLRNSVAQDNHRGNSMSQDSRIGQDSYLENSVTQNSHIGQDSHFQNSVTQDSHFETLVGQDSYIGQDHLRNSVDQDSQVENSVAQDSHIGQYNQFENFVPQDNQLRSIVTK